MKTNSATKTVIEVTKVTNSCSEIEILDTINVDDIYAISIGNNRHPKIDVILKHTDDNGIHKVITFENNSIFPIILDFKYKKGTRACI